MPFQANQVLKHFHVFISLIMAIYLAAIHVMASHHTIHVITSACQVLSFQPRRLYPTANSRYNGKFRGHHVESNNNDIILVTGYN